MTRLMLTLIFGISLIGCTNRPPPCEVWPRINDGIMPRPKIPEEDKPKYNSMSREFRVQLHQYIDSLEALRERVQRYNTLREKGNENNTDH